MIDDLDDVDQVDSEEMDLDQSDKRYTDRDLKNFDSNLALEEI